MSSNIPQERTSPTGFFNMFNLPPSPPLGIIEINNNPMEDSSFTPPLSPFKNDTTDADTPPKKRVRIMDFYEVKLIESKHEMNRDYSLSVEEGNAYVISNLTGEFNISLLLPINNTKECAEYYQALIKKFPEVKEAKAAFLNFCKHTPVTKDNAETKLLIAQSSSKDIESFDDNILLLQSIRACRNVSSKALSGAIKESFLITPKAPISQENYVEKFKLAQLFYKEKDSFKLMDQARFMFKEISDAPKIKPHYLKREALSKYAEMCLMGYGSEGVNTSEGMKYDKLAKELKKKVTITVS
ncbi:hypothetical protein AB751O23_AJ_00030 [Chlamydiales bacterium SCGC AB-751-O23]|jgi:hypothetical protein|nr:hypothetical protein AB751O23_AJ_00030 [Chlamydiales bacterium SCGC AB-751-O23]